MRAGGQAGRAMTVREFAERVLFGTTLAEKLAPPHGALRDERRGESVATPEAPGRPAGLQLRRDGVRAEFPGTHGIEDEGQRGKLLHFFANHELLATELMALVLLKFPEAPEEFRAGIVRTLKEEQMHTKLYLKRMEECGVSFGEFPVNGFFWNAVAPMPSPLDYVTRLSLTFEQANLDYSRGYAAVFGEAGDEATAAILERIYRDEIGHVHYGLSWFRRWKERRDESDWLAFTSRLELPLSAARAKGGFGFNEEGRREAGFDEDFIRELKVYAQSKGRTPNVYWFNPGAEESVAGGWDGGESPAARQVRRDLGMVAAFLARREDVVLVPEVPPTGHLERLLEAGLELPEFVREDELESLAARRLHGWRPWARTPDTVGVSAALGLQGGMTSRDLFSKAVHAGFLARLVEGSSNALLGRREVVGVAAGSVADVAAVLAMARGERWVVKAPFSTAGRDRLIREAGTELTGTEREWVESTVARQGMVVVERWLDRVLDYSVQYDFDAERGLRRRGLVLLKNTAQGQFRSATVAERFTDHLSAEDRRALFAGSSPRGAVLEFVEDELEPALGKLLEEHCYEGPLGVDAFLYRDGAGRLRFKPVVEINPRFTMGRVAVELARFTPQKVTTTLTIGKSGAGPKGALRLTPEGPGVRFAAFLSTGERA